MKLIELRNLANIRSGPDWNITMDGIKELVTDIDAEQKLLLNVRDTTVAQAQPKFNHATRKNEGDDVTDEHLRGRTRLVINGLPFISEIDVALRRERMARHEGWSGAFLSIFRALDSDMEGSPVGTRSLATFLRTVRDAPSALRPDSNPGERKMAEAEAQHVPKVNRYQAGCRAGWDGARNRLREFIKNKNDYCGAIDAVLVELDKMGEAVDPPEPRDIQSAEADTPQQALAFDDPASHPAVLRMMAKRLDATQKQAEAHEDRAYQHGKLLGHSQENLREHIDATKRATDSLANAMTDAENRLNSERMKDLKAVNADIARLEGATKRAIDGLDAKIEGAVDLNRRLVESNAVFANWGKRLDALEGHPERLGSSEKRADGRDKKLELWTAGLNARLNSLEKWRAEDHILNLSNRIAALETWSKGGPAL